MSVKKNLDYYIGLSTEIHNSNYSYPYIQSEFTNSKSRITILCGRCGDLFTQSLSHHIYSKSGCSNCFGNKKNTIEKVLQKSVKVHGQHRYSYPNLSDVSSNKKIDIICNRCGLLFRQTIHAHLNKKTGCTKCVKSRSEQQIQNYLTENDVEFISQWSDNGCRYQRKLYFDFYIPKYNLCIEYDGEQHFNSRRDDNGEKLRIQKIKDEIKNNFCIEKNINIERISYKENLSEKLLISLKSYGFIEKCTMLDIISKFSYRTEKSCSKCKVTKPLNCFSKSSRSMDGCKSICKSCSSIDGKKFYERKKNKKNR